MKVVPILLILVLFPSVITATEEILPGTEEDGLNEQGHPLKEGDQQVDDDNTEIEVNQRKVITSGLQF